MTSQTAAIPNRLSKREQLALAVLQGGGYFRKQLERTFQGREQFKTRLRNKAGAVVRGVGSATLYRFKDAGMLQSRDCPRSSVWPEEYVLGVA